MFDYNEVLDKADLKKNAFTRTLVIVGYYGVAVVTYPYFLLKHLLKK